MGEQNQRVRIGEVWKIRHGQDHRLVLVVGCSRDDFVQITLIHTFPEYALEKDIVVSLLGVRRYPIIIKGTFRTTVPSSSLEKKLFSVPSEVVVSYWDSREPLPNYCYRGYAPTGILDARVEFSAAETKVLSEISLEHFDFE